MARVMIWVMKRYVHVVAVTAAAMIVADLAIYLPAMALGLVPNTGTDALSSGIYAVNFATVVVFLLTPTVMTLWTRLGLRARLRYRGRKQVLTQTIDEWAKDRTSTETRDDDEGVRAAVSLLRACESKKEVAWLSSPSQASPLAVMNGDVAQWTRGVLLDYVRLMSIRGLFPEKDAEAIRRTRAVSSLYESMLDWSQRGATEEQAAGLPTPVLAAQADYLMTLTDDYSLDVSRAVALVKSSALLMETADEVLLIDSPMQMRTDQYGALHAQHSPALVWADGSQMWAHSGVVMDEDLARGDASVARVLGQDSIAVRHAAMEAAGFERFLNTNALEEVSSCPDPGNPGQSLTLLRFCDERMRLMGQKVLACVNGTVERDGSRRTYALTVPATMSDPVEAAAWTYGMTKKEYARALRRA